MGHIVQFRVQNPKLPLSSSAFLVKLALTFCCISTSGATLANASFKNTLVLIFIDKNAAGIKLPLSYLGI